VARWLANSLFVSLAVTSATLLLCSAAAYAFARKEFPGRDQIFWTILATMMIPGFATLIPLFVLTKNLGLHDTFAVLILPAIGSPFAIFLLRQFMVTLPGELFDAARIDGCGEVGLYARIALPLSKPALATLGTFAFVGAWNDFLWPLSVINKPEMYTIQVGVLTLRGFINLPGTDIPLTMATSAVLGLPPVIIFFLFQRYLIRGITIGALKG
jgi:multiple sugar transport system permease protein